MRVAAKSGNERLRSPAGGLKMDSFETVRIAVRVTRSDRGEALR
jgi:hypothetical protein